MNAAEALINKSAFTRLYSPMVGRCYLWDLDKEKVTVSTTNVPDEGVGQRINFLPNGKVDNNGEMMLFPSPVMKDWDKFAWEEDDFLKSSLNKRIVKFKDWNNDDYTEFRAYDENGNLNFYCSVEFNKVTIGEPLRPGQRVLVRDSEDDEWKLHFFSHYQDGDTTLPICIGGDSFVNTIPYKGNQDLLGTTKSK